MSEKNLQERTVVDGVLKKVNEFVNEGTLNLPTDYSPGNALRSAWLILQDLTDKDGKPALEVCTRDSVAHSLLKMTVEGLNPEKKQAYFIVYGKKLQCQRSYFGSQVLAKRVNPNIADFPAQVVYAGDTFDVEVVRGKTRIRRHLMKNWGSPKSEIVGAYCDVVDKNGKTISTTLMTIEQIKQAWAQSKMKPVADDGNIKTGTTHDKFTVDMCIKTVISKACKPIINGSSDAGLLGKFIQDEIDRERPAEERLDEEMAEEANAKVIDVDTETGEVKQQAGGQESETAPAADEQVEAGF